MAHHLQIPRKLILFSLQSVLVRLYGDNTEAFIDRAIENSTWHLVDAHLYDRTMLTDSTS